MIALSGVHTGLCFADGTAPCDSPLPALCRKAQYVFTQAFLRYTFKEYRYQTSFPPSCQVLHLTMLYHSAFSISSWASVAPALTENELPPSEKFLSRRHNPIPGFPYIRRVHQPKNQEPHTRPTTTFYMPDIPAHSQSIPKGVV